MNLLALFPELDRELNLTFNAASKITKSSFQNSKERVIVAEVFFNKSDLAENDRREIVALIKDAGDSKELKTRLKSWESQPAGMFSSLLSRITSFLDLKRWASGGIDEAVQKSKDIQDQAFLADLQEKVSKEPLLEQLVQDVVVEAHAYLKEFMRHQLRKLYSCAHNIKQKRMHHQVEAEAKNQDQERRKSSRNGWFDDIEMAQAQANPGYV